MQADPIFSVNNDWIFWPATLAHVDSAWLGHLPFGHWLVGAIAPATIVELGTHVGSSYGSFCESVKRNNLPTRCWAVDTWRGDEHSGSYGEEVFAALSKVNTRLYGEFSRLLRMTFDEAVTEFPDGSVDLLHIDGLHTYDAVRHDFEAWHRKLSPRAVVLFHDISVDRPDFGVRQLWGELCVERRSFAFSHAAGLGVLEVYRDGCGALAPLLDVTLERAGEIRERFAFLGLQYSRPAELTRQLRMARR